MANKLLRTFFWCLSRKGVAIHAYLILNLRRLRSSRQTLSGDSPETSQIVPEIFFETFWGPAAGGPGIFETLSASRAGRAQETSVTGGLVPNTHSLIAFFPEGQRHTN